MSGQSGCGMKSLASANVGIPVSSRSCILSKIREMILCGLSIEGEESDFGFRKSKGKVGMVRTNAEKKTPRGFRFGAFWGFYGYSAVRCEIATTVYKMW